MSKLVIVEAPSKAKTISKYLGAEYIVTSSYGHIRGLPSKPGSVDPDKNFFMLYETNKGAEKHIKSIVTQAKKCDEIYLASDPDREGEAIAWHVAQIMQEKKVLANKKVKRIAFHEITKKAVQESIKNARDIDMSLVNAQQTRQALDYLVGFTLSPLLWRKLPGSKSAGRVQSVALRLICERESEIEQFKEREYWSIKGLFEATKKEPFAADLVMLDGKKLEKFSITDEKEAKQTVALLKKHQYAITDIKEKQVKRNPYAPFTTSTMLQDASRKLGFTAKRTSRAAQHLYEGVQLSGSDDNTALITYIRTDSVRISDSAIESIRAYVKQNIGPDFIPKTKRSYATKTRNAQEAHEAIRPIDCDITPKSIKGKVGQDEWKLYNLIWQRTVASQMSSAISNNTIVSIDAATGEKSKQIQFRATGNRIIFEGFTAIYADTKEEKDSKAGSDLPELALGEDVNVKEIKPHQHFTQPPPRFSEASLVKNLEELGIGRPSTYTSIISILQDRGYVTLDKKRFTPENRGRVVTTFLTEFFQQYVDYDFTAALETKLDDVSNGKKELQEVLQDFWKPFYAVNNEVASMKTAGILESIEKKMESFLFPKEDGVANSKTCPKCGKGTLGLKVGKFSPFVGCSEYPNCSYSRALMSTDDMGSDNGGEVSEFPIDLGNDEHGNPVTIRSGPYGLYVQVDNPNKGSDEKPSSKATKISAKASETTKKSGAKKSSKKKSDVKRAAIPKDKNYKEVDLSYAVKLLSMPRVVGEHEGEVVKAGIGRFGPYLLYNGKFTSIKNHDPILIEIDEAIPLLSSSKRSS